MPSFLPEPVTGDDWVKMTQPVDLRAGLTMEGIGLILKTLREKAGGSLGFVELPQTKRVPPAVETIPPSSSPTPIPCTQHLP